MSEEHFQEITKELNELSARLAKTVPGSSNTVEYNRWLKKTLEKARTFDKKDKEHYIDYVARSIKTSDEAAMEKTKKPKSADDDAKKRKPVDNESDEEASGKKTKKPAKKPEQK